MSLIVRQLKKKSDYSPVSYNDFPRESLELEDSFENLELYTYTPGSNPIPKNQVYSEDVYNDSINDAPIDVFFNKDGDLNKDSREIARQIFDTYGEGRYNVFIFGGNPPREPVFDKPIVIREKRGEKK